MKQALYALSLFALVALADFAAAKPSEARCRLNPNAIGCEGSEAYCEQNPHRIGC